MPTFADLDYDFVCPYRKGCPYLEGLSTSWVFREYQESVGLRCEYESQIEQLNHQLDEANGRISQMEKELHQLKAQLHALHRRQFKGRKAPAAPASGCPSAQRKKRGAPVGHPPWQRPKPKHIDQVVKVAAPKTCPKCESPDLQ